MDGIADPVALYSDLNEHRMTHDITLIDRQLKETTRFPPGPVCQTKGVVLALDGSACRADMGTEVSIKMS